MGFTMRITWSIRWRFMPMRPRRLSAGSSSRKDVRNCTKCDAESDVRKERPSRLACLACHDSHEAKIQAKIMTYIPDPADPYGPTAVESCIICHGADTEFSPDRVHRISSPFVPPYPREPAEP